MARSLLHTLKPFWKRALTVAGVLLVLFLLANYLVMPLYVNHGSRLAVPGVLGMSFDSAQVALTQAGLVPVQGDTRPDPRYAAGTVVFQNPLAGAVVKEGRRVYLTLSGGEVQVAVPLLRGRTLRDAKFALERFGLRVGSVTGAMSDAFPSGTIIEQSHPADTRVPRGSFVGLVVSSGKPVSATTVPLLEGKTLGEVEKLLTEAGLRIGQITYQPNFELLPNTIVAQFPRAGEAATEGQAVDLFVVRAGKPVEEIKKPARPDHSP